MNINDINLYCCPATNKSLRLDDSTSSVTSEEIISGNLMTADGRCYPISNGIPDFTWPPHLSTSDQASREEYDAAADSYDELQTVTFSILKTEEDVFRRKMIDLLHLAPGGKVLETAGGTGLNIKHIKEVMHGQGELSLQDISHKMLAHCSPALETESTDGAWSVSRSCANAAYLPYHDNYFDAALSFGGIGVFSDVKRAISEMFRVVKPGGRIVFGDEGVAPWLRESNYGKILMENNPFYCDLPPLDLLPVEARDVSVHWVMGGGFYLVDLTVGSGEPDADFDFPIPGRRGGTLHTRYFGRLEGVTPDTHDLAWEAQKKAGTSMHAWLEAAVRSAAKKTLED